MMNTISVIKILIGTVFGIILLQPEPLFGQEDYNSDNIIPLYDNLGDYSKAVTTDSNSAQAYFDQGMRLAYSFARADAARSFRAAQQLDPDCAMCYWGEAWVLGPYQNNPGGVGDYEDAVRASKEALERINGVEPWEQALIEAIVIRYPDTANDNSEAATEAYADAMTDVMASYEGDLEVATLYAESLMMFRPWNLYRPDGDPYPETRRAIEVLEETLEKDLRHPGACHLYIHVVEAWQPERAEACAGLLSDSIPGVAHMQHMPSHAYVNTGRYGDSVRDNQRARIVVQASRHDEGVVVYEGHNTSMLVFAAWLDGQSGVAFSAARDLARLNPDAFFQYDLQLARFGRWDVLLEQDREPEETFHSGLSRWAYGLAHLRTENPDLALEELERIRSIRNETPEDATYAFYEFSQRDLLGIAENILAGEIAAADGRYPDAENYLREAIKLEDSLPYSEPEPWPIPARHVLGAVLLEANQPVEAEEVYREALDIHPKNGWSLKGLKQSLDAQGKDAEARQAKRQFEEAWKRADVWLPASRF